MFTNIISLGHFCSVASELDRMGFRCRSGPFDWLISPWGAVHELIASHFHDFLNRELLYQQEGNRDYYINSKYNVEFYHDFSRHKNLDDQIDDVVKKYSRRISRFYEAIEQPTLFVRYILDQSELAEIEQNYAEIDRMFRCFHKDNTLIFIASEPLQSSLLKVYSVEPDQNDSVARMFLKKNEELTAYLLSGIYPEMQRRANLAFCFAKLSRKRSLFVSSGSASGACAAQVRSVCPHGKILE